MKAQSTLVMRDVQESINCCIAKVNLVMVLSSFLGGAAISVTAFSGGSSFFMIAGLTLMTPALTAMIVCRIVAQHLKVFAESVLVGSNLEKAEYEVD